MHCIIPGRRVSVVLLSLRHQDLSESRSNLKAQDETGHAKHSQPFSACHMPCVTAVPPGKLSNFFQRRREVEGRNFRKLAAATFMGIYLEVQTRCSYPTSALKGYPTHRLDTITKSTLVQRPKSRPSRSRSSATAIRRSSASSHSTREA